MSTSVDLVYEQVRKMAANFDLKPGERVNESELSKKLGASRTPLREAMNRLAAEGLLRFEGGRGFFCQSLSPEGVVHLYELRAALEADAVRLAVKRATTAELAELKRYLDGIATRYVDGTQAREIVALDEEFHLKIAELSGNPEIRNMLELTCQRIRYVRWIAMREKINITHAAHSHILDAILARNAEAAVARMRQHIQTSTEQATRTVEKAFAQLYVPRQVHQTPTKDQ